MNNKINILLSVLVGIIVIIFLFTEKEKTVGNMNNNIKEIKTSKSSFSFSGNKGDRIKVSLRTTVTHGTIDFILTDSSGNVVKELDRAKALEEFINLNLDDKYTMTAIYKEFTGKFNIKISKNRF